MSDNRFKDVINAAREREQQPQPPQQPPRQAAPPALTQAPAAQASAPGPQAVSQQPRRGRPPGGKRSNADFVQVSTYVKKETYRRVKIRLLEMEPEGEFGDLVEALLTRWLQGKTSS